MHTGQLGQGQSSRYQKAPVAVSSLDSKGITKIVAGGCLFVAWCVDSGAVLTHDVCVDVGRQANTSRTPFHAAAMCTLGDSAWRARYSCVCHVACGRLRL